MSVSWYIQRERVGLYQSPEFLTIYFSICIFYIPTQYSVAATNQWIVANTELYFLLTDIDNSYTDGDGDDKQQYYRREIEPAQ